MNKTENKSFQTAVTSNTAPGLRVPVTPETALKDIRMATDAHIAPDGKRAAFVLWEWVSERKKQRGRIWLVDTDGGEARPLTRGQQADTSPRWSPDGTQLAFISKAEGEKEKPQLHLIATEGGEAELVCKLPNGVSDLSWSPDGSRIAFLSVEGEEPQDDPKVLTPGKGRHRRLWTVRVDNDTPEPVTPDGQSIWQYAWSPDGTQFAVYFTDGPDETDWYRGQIGTVPACGGVVRQVTQLTRQACTLAWSPDGRQLAYISGEWSDPDRGGGDICVLSLDTREARNLTPGIECSPSWCQWFPDSRRLLYVAWAGVSYQIGMVDEQGKITTLVDDINVGERLWPHLSTTPDLQQFVFTHSEQGRAPLIGEKTQATLWGRPRGRLGTDGSGKGCLRGRPRGRLGSGGLAPTALRGRPGLLGSTQATGAT